MIPARTKNRRHRNHTEAAREEFRRANENYDNLRIISFLRPEIMYLLGGGWPVNPKDKPDKNLRKASAFVSLRLFTVAAIFLGMVLVIAAPLRADPAPKIDCHTADRVAAFTALLKTKPRKGLVENFILKNNVAKNAPYPKKNPSLIIASISDSNCDPMDYQHDQHVFYISFRKNVAVSFTRALASGGP
jgi:hypothetical protein